MPRSPQTVTLIGAGLNGPLLALGLVRRGFKVEIYERRPDMRRVPISAGRSINLALSVRGIHALAEAGLWRDMRKIIIPMKGRMMHSIRGELTFQPYGKDESEVINSISRADLNIALMNAAEAQGVKIFFQQRCVGVDLQTGTIQLCDEISGNERSVETDVVIGCDGSASAIRSEMLKGIRFNFSQEYLDYGYKELTIPAGLARKHVLETNALHIWPRGNYMLIALPNVDGTFACILFLPFEGQDCFAELASPQAVQEFFELRFPDALPLMPQLPQNFFANPTGAMVTIKCSPWHAAGKVLLQLLDQSRGNWEHTFREFEQARKVNTDAIADLALENFVEMRDRVADPRFLFRKKVELALEAKYPEIFVPKYSMVTFHRIPYGTAKTRGEIQDRLMTELCDGVNSLDDLDWTKADHLIRAQLTALEPA
jgi:kynurenine 3-monooxygenase